MRVAGRNLIISRPDAQPDIIANTLGLSPAWAAAMQPPDRRPIYEWARENLALPAAYAVPGQLDFSSSRYLLAPLNAIQSETVRKISCYGAIQTGKSLMVETAIPWVIANAPGPIMWTMQSDQDAKEQAQTRFNELLRTCRPVAALMPQDRHKATTTETYFGNFFLLLNGANLNNLQSKSIRWKFNSEVWLWKPGLLEHAEGRVSKFEETQSSKVFNESQGGVAGDDMDVAWRAGHCAAWNIRCAGCAQLVPLDFFARCDGDAAKYAGVIWADDAKRPDGSYNIGRAADSARWKCRKCGHEHANTARTRATWNTGGDYVAENPTAPEAVRSFRWNALVSRDLGALVAQWLGARDQKKRGIMQPTRDFYQKRLALAWKKEEEIETFVLHGDGYRLAEVAAAPKDKISNEVERFLTADRQRDHWWVVVRAWRNDGGSRLLYFSRAQTIEEVRDIQQTYGVRDSLTFQDAQHATAEVYGDCVRYGWTALHGSGEASFAHHLRSGKEVRRFYSVLKQAAVPGGLAPYVHWSSEPVKDTVHALRTGRGASWETPDDAPEDYVKQLSGDQKRERVSKRTGRLEWRWQRVGENHAWDCEAMQVAAALMLRVLSAAEPEAAGAGN